MVRKTEKGKKECKDINCPSHGNLIPRGREFIGTIVAKDVPPFAVVGGNPAKIIKYRFSEKNIKALLKIKWWDWDEQIIRDNINLLSSKALNKFIEIYSGDI